MNLTGWIITSVLSFLVLFFSIRWILEFKLNQKLKTFQKIKHISIRRTFTFGLRRMTTVMITSTLLGVTVLSGCFQSSFMLNDKTLLNAKPVLSEAKLKSLISNNSQQSVWERMFGGIDDAVAAPEAGGDFDKQSNRDFIDTNVQVEGVSEADIVKTDGNTIYYASRFQNRVRAFDIALDHKITVKEDIDLEYFYVDNMFLTSDYLVVLGYQYTYQNVPWKGDDSVRDYFPGYYVMYTGSVVVIDRQSLEVVYTLETDGYYYDYRMIDDVLFLVSKKSIYDHEIRPMFKETRNNQEEITYLDYDQIYYFEDVPFYSMSVLSALDLSDFSLSSQALLSDISHLYVTHDAIYTAYNFWHYKTNRWDDYQELVQIIKYDLDIENSSITYVGSTILEGHVHNQFWMDAYQSYFRVVTTRWNPQTLNVLYILEEDQETDTLHVITKLDKGIGKPNERVMSVRFNKELVYIVTFEVIDPLYTIDLSDPKKPVFIGDIEEPGFSTYLHVWLEDDQLIGFGHDADPLTGMITGLKISAYDTALSEPLQTYQIGQQSFDQVGFSYSFSEAIYNHKAMMVSPSHGIIGFSVMSYTYRNQPYWSYEYQSLYMIFFIDFTQEQVISEPVIIEHDASEYYYSIDRGVYIDGVIYTLSYHQIKSYHLENRVILESIDLI